MLDLDGGGPSAVDVIFDDRDQNIGFSRVSGVDFRARYQQLTRFGNLTFNLAGSREFQNQYQTLVGVPAINLLNIVGEPVAWKGRASLGWSQGAWAVTLSGNYVGAYKNEYFVPETSVSSWFTSDLAISFHTSDSGLQPLRNIKVAFFIRNLTDARPPAAPMPPTLLLGVPNLPYDPANANPLGRIIAIELTKTW